VLDPIGQAVPTAWPDPTAPPDIPVSPAPAMWRDPTAPPSEHPAASRAGHAPAVLGSKRKGQPPRRRPAAPAGPDRADASARLDQADRTARLDQADRLDRTARFDQADRLDRTARPGRADPGDRTARPDRADPGDRAAATAGAPRGPTERPPTGPADAPPKPAPLPGRDPLWARLLIGVGVLLLLSSIGLIGAGKLLASRYDGSVRKDNLLGDSARAVPRAEPRRITGPLNYLLLGSDARPDDPTLGQRADTVIVAHVPASLDRVYLLSLPRDLRVEIPPFEPTGYRGGHEKINAAYEHGGGGTGGIQLLSMTVANLLGIRFDGAALVDFNGFQEVVKALGGVDMCIDHRVVSEHIGFDEKGEFLAPSDGGKAVVYEVGCRELNSWQALDYVRQRYSLPDGDYGRQRHQQQFLRALLVRARQKGYATNPIKLDRLIRAVAGTVTVDTGGVPLDALMFGLRGIGPDSIVGLALPSEPQWLGDTSYVIAFEEAAGLYRAIADDTVASWAAENPTWVPKL
jgi:LCP family protein required for cell wall assembly